MMALLAVCPGYRSLAGRLRASLAAWVMACCFLMLGTSTWASGKPTAELRSFDVEQERGVSSVSLRVRGPFTYKTLNLSNPTRFVLDFEATTLQAPSKRRLEAAHGLRSIRASQYKPTITRVVFDLAEGATATVGSDSEGLTVRVTSTQGRAEEAPRAAPEAARAAPKATARTTSEARADTARDQAPAAVAQPSTTPNVAAKQAEKPTAGKARPTTSATRSVASITYITPSSVYVDAGSGDNLQIRDVLEVVRAGKSVARLGVEHLSSRKAACGVLESSVELVVGDTVRFTPHASAERPREDTSGGLSSSSPGINGNRRSSRSGPGWLRQNGIRGKVGARFLTVIDRGGSGQDFSQPALDLRIDGRSIGDSPLDLTVDVRARQTYRTSSDGSTSNDGRSRVYQAAGTWHPHDSMFNLRIGRQYSPDLPTLSIFDGAAATLRFSHWSLGILSGTQPDPVDYGYSTEIRDSGGFLQISSSKAPADLWYVTIGVIGSYVAGDINREFATLQASYSQPRFSAYVSQDIDLNRGWRREAEGSDHTLTNTYVTSRWRATEGLRVHAGYDNRRNIRLHRDLESPETEFDDAHRQGFWGGFAQRFARRYRLGFDAKRATGGSSGNADAFTLTVTAQWRVHANLRSTYFTNQLTNGWMHAGLLGAQLLPWMHVEIGGGMRDETSDIDLPQQDTLTWMHFALDHSLGRHWYLSFSAERSKEGIEANDQYYVSTNYRF